MKLCWREGEFLYPVYVALRDELSWAEVQRVQTTGAIIADRDGDYNEWIIKHGDRVRKLLSKQEAGDGEEGGGLTLDDYLRELDGQKQGLASANEELSKHRAALATGRGADEGLLTPEKAEFVQQMADIQSTKVEQIEAAIVELFGDGNATLKGD